MKRLYLLFFALVCLSCASSSQLDRPGLIQIDKEGVKKPGEKGEKALKKAQKFLEEKKYYKAAQLAHSIFVHSRRPRLRARALYAVGEANYRAGSYRQAHEKFTLLREKFAFSKKVPQALQRIYEIGSAWTSGRERPYIWFFTTRDLEKGIGILRQLIDDYPFLRSPQGELIADDAAYTIAETHFRTGEYEKCRKFYQVVLRRYSQSEWADLSAFKIGLSHLRQSEGVQYDLRPLDLAIKKFKEYLQKFPRGNKVKEVQSLLSQIYEDRARHMFEIADYYLYKDELPGAVIYYKAIIREYPQTKWAKKAKEKMKEEWAKKAWMEWKNKKP